jgi:pectin methylesterase-like acyl-CoA thioesterase
VGALARPLPRALAPAAVALALVTCFVIAAPRAVAGTTIRVPEDYSTIQAAVDAASSGDVIDIAPGIYRETITIRRSVTVRGRVYSATNPRQNTTIGRPRRGEWRRWHHHEQPHQRQALLFRR